MRKLTTYLLVMVLAFTCVFTLSACKEDVQTTPEKEIYSVALNEYDINLNVGQTFDLDVKKYDKNGKEQTAENISFFVEASEVASISKSGKITATQAGTTYINVQVDDCEEVACYVTVKSSSALNGLVINFTGKVYKGLSMQAYAMIYEDGKMVGYADNVTYSGSDETKATVTESGYVTGLEVCDGLKITASCTYGGKEYTTEKELSVYAPYYYVISNSLIRLASNTTLTGATNSAYTVKDDITVSKINVLDSEDREIVQQVTAKVINEQIAQIETDEQGKVKIIAKQSGVTSAKIDVSETNMSIVAKIEVYNTISSIADMDKLAFASLNNPSLLSGSYVLVSDIDYQNQVIYPIASYKLNDTSTANRVVGNQWQYHLNKAEDGYAPVAREDFGKTGQGLSDEDFIAFANKKGINPNQLSFSGVFDGNGHSIKNAQIFFGSYLMEEKSNNLSNPEYGSIFGYLTGTLKNVSFEDISIQDPTSMISQGKKFCADNKTLRKSTDGYFQFRGTAIVGRAIGADINNVYANINYNHKVSSSWFKGVLVSETGNAKISNCVTYSGGFNENDYGIDTALSATTSIVKNSLSLNVKRLSKNYTSTNSNGVEGNYYALHGKTWKDLAQTLGNGLTAEQSAKATFNTAIWDLSLFNATDGGRPTLIKGCSLA